LRIASGGDDATGAEPLGHLNGHLPGTPGAAQHQHGLAGLKADPSSQRDPRRHRRVHRRGH
jgi:hypothetical protein